MTSSLLGQLSGLEEAPLENRLVLASNSIATFEEVWATQLVSPPISIQSSFQERVIGMDLAHRSFSDRSIERKFNFTSHSLDTEDKDIQRQQSYWKNSL